MGFEQVGKFELYNDGGFVCDIHAVYIDSHGHDQERVNGENFPIAQSRTMDLGKKCDGITDGSLVKMKVWIALGKDNTYNQYFSYEPGGPTRKFKISGATLNNSIQYEG